MAIAFVFIGLFALFATYRAFAVAVIATWYGKFGAIHAVGWCTVIAMGICWCFDEGSFGPLVSVAGLLSIYATISTAGVALGRNGYAIVLLSWCSVIAMVAALVLGGGIFYMSYYSAPGMRGDGLRFLLIGIPMIAVSFVFLRLTTFIERLVHQRVSDSAKSHAPSDN